MPFAGHALLVSGQASLNKARDIGDRDMSEHGERSIHVLVGAISTLTYAGLHDGLIQSA